MTGFQSDEGLHHLPDGRVRNTDRAGLGDRRVFHQRALDLERADQVARAFDHVVDPADEPEVAVGILFREVAGQVPAVGEAFGVARFFAEVAAEDRRPARPERQLALGPRPGNRREAAIRAASNDGRLDARQRPPHRARLHVHQTVVCDHDPTGLGLPPIVVDGKVERLLAPDHGLGIERFADAGDEPQRRGVHPARDLGADPHHHPDRGRRGVPDSGFLHVEDAKPAFGTEFRRVDDQGCAVGKRRDDAVGGAGNPTGIGSAPEHVVRAEIAGEPTGDMMRDHGRVDAHRPLGTPGRAGGEVQERHVFGVGRRDLEIRAGRSQKRAQIVGAGDIHRGLRRPDDEDALEVRQRLAEQLDLAPVEAFGGDERFRRADDQALSDRLEVEGGKQRAEDAPGLQRSEGGDIEFRDAAREREDAVARTDPAGAENVGEAVGLGPQIGVAQIADRPAFRDPADGRRPGERAIAMPVHRLVGDIQLSAARQPVELRPCRAPVRAARVSA